jgi:hypothetical protein
MIKKVDDLIIKSKHYSIQCLSFVTLNQWFKVVKWDKSIGFEFGATVVAAVPTQAWNKPALGTSYLGLL